uniref:Embryo sac development arrest 6 n=1 Tax=Vitis vinifera TaxID=29760 RepID=A5CBW1_VITVI|nr:hypothetical protein VITISV_041609 [Vitis vinifera]
MSKTMKHPPRRVATPTASDKRKEREAFYAPEIPKIPKLAAPRAGSSKPYEPAYRNQLLAGYLAHEFLTKGTLLGEKWDPDRADAAPVPVEFKRKEKGKGKGRAEPSAEAYNRTCLVEGGSQSRKKKRRRKERCGVNLCPAIQVMVRSVELTGLI